MEKYSRAGLVTDNKMDHAHCMLNKCKLGICNNICFSIATLVAQKCLNVTLRVHTYLLNYLLTYSMVQSPS